jgi:polyhydroxyalkanoate synthesis regulator phasin
MNDDKKTGFGDLMQKAFYLGVGVANLAAQRASTALQELRQQSQKLADEMVKRGEMSVEDAKRFVDEMVKNAQASSEPSSARKSDQPRQIEIVIEDDEDEKVAALKKKVQALQEELRNLNPE